VGSFEDTAAADLVHGTLTSHGGGYAVYVSGRYPATLTVTGSGTLLDASLDSLTIAWFDTDQGVVNVTGGGTVRAYDVLLGRGTGLLNVTGGAVTPSLRRSELDVTHDIMVGHDGTQGLYVTNGALVQCGHDLLVPLPETGSSVAAGVASVSG